MAKPKQPAIPAIPSDTPKALRPFMSAMREVVQILAGQGRGSELDQAVTYRDLGARSGGGTAAIAGALQGLIDQGGVQAYSPVDRPTTPSGVGVTNYVGGVFVQWDLPRYNGHSHTEVYLQQTAVDGNNDPVDAPALDLDTMLAGSSSSAAVGLSVRTGYGYYVWVRHVNQSQQAGPIHAVGGTFLFHPHAPTYLLEQLSAQIQESHLAQTLSESISEIPGLVQVAEGNTTNLFLNPAFAGGLPHGFGISGAVYPSSDGTVPASCPVSNVLRIQNRDTLGKTIDVVPGDLLSFSMLCATYDATAPQIQIGAKFTRKDGSVLAWTGAVTRTTSSTWKQIAGTLTVPADAAQAQLWVQLNYNDTNHHWFITGVSFSLGAGAMWSVRSQVGDIKAGIGVWTGTGGQSEVAVAASRFYVFDPNDPTNSYKALLAVSGGQVLINNAAIDTAYIQTLAAGEITAARINALTLNAINITGGTITGTALRGGTLGIGTGGPYSGYNTFIESTGQLKTNNLYATGGTFTGTVTATGGTFSNCTISSNCTIQGTLNANQIVGDITAMKNWSWGGATSYAGGNWINIISTTLAGASFDRWLLVSDFYVTATSGYITVEVIVGGVTKFSKEYQASTTVKIPGVTVGASGNVGVELRFKCTYGAQVSVYSQDIQLTVFKKDTGTFL